MRTRFSCRPLFRAGLVLAVVGAALGAAPASVGAQSERSGYFSDDDGGVHEPALDALAERGVLVGIECGQGLICPGESLKRWEMAVWLVRVLDGTDPAPTGVSRFTDVDAERWWAPFVDRFYALGVTAGCVTEPAQFCPEGDVNRAQMATFLKRALDLEPAPSAGFADVSGGAHGASIDALAAAGITGGCSRDPLRYCPASSVTRAHMATFLARALGLVELPASVRFTGIDAGYGHTCGLRADRTVACWGDNHYGQSNAPGGQFLGVSAGGRHSCALRTDRSVVCWGANNYGESDAPGGDFQAVSAGFGHACGLRTDSTISCWGGNLSAESDAPDGSFDSVTAGFLFSCASGEDGMTCWGSSDAGQDELPAGRLIGLSSGSGHVCGLRLDDSAVTCWGNDFDGQSSPPDGRFRSVSAGGEHTCGLHHNQTIACWGNDRSGRIDPPRGQFMAVTAGGTHSCGVRLDGTAVCWGDTADGRSRAPGGQFASVSAGGRHTCGLLTDSTIACWGHNDTGQAYAPPGEFNGVSVGERHTCAVSTDEKVVCWGRNHFRAVVPEGRFSDVSSGTSLSCALRIHKTIACWGTNTEVETVPEGHFEAVSTGFSHACALRGDQTIVCWGHGSGDSLQEIVDQTPDGRFKSVSAGSWHSCALRVDETVVCWGSLNLWGETASPPGRFRAVSVGGGHSCGILQDGEVDCWGRNSSGEAQAPAGPFASVTAGDEHTCGLRTDGTVVCWGHATVARPPGVRSPYAHDRPDPAACRVFGVPNFISVGFPRYRSAAPATGTVKVAVLFMDFPDAAASYSTRDEVGEAFRYAERYLEEASYGALDIEFSVLHRWLRSEHEHSHYLVGTYLSDFDSEAARLADPEVDFSGVDILMTVLPGEHFSGGTAIGPVVTQEGVVGTSVRINALRPMINFGAGSPGPRDWGWIAAHELLHALGLADLYRIDGVPDLIDEPPGKLRFEAEFGIMGLRTFFLLDEDDQRMFTYFRGTEGEMLAWSRWLLGWLDVDQIHCVSGDDATVALRPVARNPGTGTAMAAVPLTANEVIVVESRRSIGRDVARLLEEGVLVYTVNASVQTGFLPIEVISAPDEGFPVLGVGETVTVRGYRITVTADDGDTHTVTITRAAGG